MEKEMVLKILGLEQVSETHWRIPQLNLTIFLSNEGPLIQVQGIDGLPRSLKKEGDRFFKKLKATPFELCSALHQLVGARESRIAQAMSSKCVVINEEATLISVDSFGIFLQYSLGQCLPFRITGKELNLEEREAFLTFPINEALRRIRNEKR